MQLRTFKRYNAKHGQTQYFNRLVFQDQEAYQNYVEKCRQILGEPEPEGIIVESLLDRHRWINKPEKLTVCIKTVEDLKKIVDTITVLHIQRHYNEPTDDIELWVKNVFSDGGCIFDSHHRHFICINAAVYTACSLAWL